MLQKAKNTYTLWLKIAGNIPKAQRYTLGGKIDSRFLELLEEIFIALYLPVAHKVSRIGLGLQRMLARTWLKNVRMNAPSGVIS